MHRGIFQKRTEEDQDSYVDEYHPRQRHTGAVVAATAAAAGVI